MVKTEFIEFFCKYIDTDIKVKFFGDIAQRFASSITIFYHMAFNDSSIAFFENSRTFLLWRWFTLSGFLVINPHFSDGLIIDAKLPPNGRK
jgi:hypothetical protein